VLLPVALFLGGSGAAGYLYIRNALLQQWREAAILRLERAAHLLDMRLGEPLQWAQALAKTAPGRSAAEQQQWVLKQLKSQPGVSEVRLDGNAAPAGVAAVSPPEYFYPADRQEVGMRFRLLDQRGKALGRLEVILAYDYLMADLLTTGWMQSNMACLVNDQGLYLAHSNPSMAGRHCLGETQDVLELAMRAELKAKLYGTLIGGDRVIGYYRLIAAPWAIMLHARASQILAPIRRFQFYYLTGGLVYLGVILLLIRVGMGPVVAAIRRLAGRAAAVARGEYGEPLPVRSRDEIGLLSRGFNDMVHGLKERDFIRNTFGRYMDESLARELLGRPEALRLGGEKRQVVILFSDIRGFIPSSL